MKEYIEILKNILKNFSDNEDFILIIKSILIKIFDIYYLERNVQLYNIDNLFRKYNINMYNLLKRRYDMTKSQKLIFKKHKYIKKGYVIKLLKNNNIILNKDESYNKIANEILKKENIKCYVSYINDFVKNRIVIESKICFHPPCLKKVENDNYCHNHQNEKICNF